MLLEEDPGFVKGGGQWQAGSMSP